MMSGHLRSSSYFRFKITLSSSFQARKIEPKILLVLFEILTHLKPIFPCLILQQTRTQRRLVMMIPRLRVNTAKPGIFISVSSSPSSAISSDSNFSSGLSVVVVVVAGGLLVVVFLVVEVTLEAGLAVA